MKVLAIVFIVVFCGSAQAGRGHRIRIPSFTCEDVKAALALFHSMEEALAFGKAYGATEAQITKAKTCLK